LTTAKLGMYIVDNFTNDEVLRLFDLANRRVIDYGEELYTKKEQNMFKKVRETWHIFTKGKMC